MSRPTRVSAGALAIRSRRIAMIAAIDLGYVIGVDNDLPWSLPSDLKRFKQVTLGKPIVMGRPTFESIGRPLPGRRNIVLTRRTDYAPDGCEIANTLGDAFKLAGDTDEVMVIGGARVYELALPMADRLYLTIIHDRFAGDTYFPRLSPAHWRCAEREEFSADERNPHAHTYLVLDRQKPSAYSSQEVESVGADGRPEYAAEGAGLLLEQWRPR